MAASYKGIARAAAFRRRREQGSETPFIWSEDVSAEVFVAGEFTKVLVDVNRIDLK